MTLSDLLAKLNAAEVNNITVPITANIGGTFTSPNITTDLASSASNVSKQLIEVQKQKLLGKGKDKINGLLGGLLGGSSNSSNPNATVTDSTKTNTEDTIKNGVKSIRL